MGWPWDGHGMAMGQWLDLRENLQETIDFPMKYGMSCNFSPTTNQLFGMLADVGCSTPSGWWFFAMLSRGPSEKYESQLGLNEIPN